MVYKKKWSLWGKENTGPDSEPSNGDVNDEPILEEEDEEPDDENDSGALIIVNSEKAKYAKIKKNEVCYLIVENNRAVWDGKCVPVSNDTNKYPPDIVAAIQSKDKNWYFFDKNGKHCTRKEKDKNKCTKWKDNKQIFGCEENDKKPELEQLCINPKIKAGTHLNTYIYIFRGRKYWEFDNKPENKKPFGNLVEGNIPADTKWSGIHFEGGSSHNKGAFLMVYSNKWSQWVSNDDLNSKLKEVSDEPIGEPTDEKESLGDDDDLGALINTEKDDKYAKIRGNQICYISIKNNKAFYEEKWKPLTEDKNNYPANSIAAVKGKDKYWYYFNNEGKYCKRKDKDTIQCTEWNDNKEVFGCDKNAKPELESLCKKPKITAAGNHPPFIYILRGGKYWKFDNKPKPKKPFGNLIEGSLQANKKWPGIHISGGSSYHKMSYIMVYKTKWSLWNNFEESTHSDSTTQSDSDNSDSSSGDVYDQSIMDKDMDEENIDDDNNSGALIIVDEKQGMYAKIKNDTVCPLIISNNKCNWIGKCIPVSEDANNFPPNIWGAVKARDKNWYYFDKNGKYCKRAINDKSQCTKWENNKDIFGCNDRNIKPELESLCNNPKIKASSNFAPHIYILSGKNYWKFDNSPKPGKPFGELLEGDKPATDLWSGITLPGGSSYYNFNFIIVYNNKWSKWKSSLNSDSTEMDVNNEPIVEAEEETPDEPDGDPKDSGALIAINERAGKYAMIKGDNVCYYLFKDSRMSSVGHCLSVTEDKNKYPPNIVAVIKDRDKNSIFFNKNGLYCQRAKDDQNECNQWKDSGEIFGCKINNIKDSLKKLCKNVRIISGTNFSPYIYVFRGGKYWKFDNKPKANKPIGDLVLGGDMARDRWLGIHFPGGSGYNLLSFIMIYDNKWSLWRSSMDSKGVNVTDEVIGISDISLDEFNAVVASVRNYGSIDEEDIDIDREPPIKEGSELNRKKREHGQRQRQYTSPRQQYRYGQQYRQSQRQYRLRQHYYTQSGQRYWQQQHRYRQPQQQKIYK